MSRHNGRRFSEMVKYHIDKRLCVTVHLQSAITTASERIQTASYKRLLL